MEGAKKQAIGNLGGWTASTCSRDGGRVGLAGAMPPPNFLKKKKIIRWKKKSSKKLKNIR
jgi:hypothetical protein